MKKCQKSIIERVSGGGALLESPCKFRKLGFTLAEVLITLGIVGVVAALTIPGLVANYQKAQTVNALKKTYTDLIQIQKRAIFDYGEPDGWDYPTPYNENSIIEFLNKYYLPYLNGARIYTESELNNKLNHQIKNLNGKHVGYANPGIMLSDGRILRFFPSNSNYTWIYVDINGTAPPNKVGRDVFMMYQYVGSKYNVQFVGDGTSRTYLMREGISYTDENNRSGFGCSKENKFGYYAGWYCGALIKQDGWKISDDYPW